MEDEGGSTQYIPIFHDFVYGYRPRISVKSCLFNFLIIDDRKSKQWGPRTILAEELQGTQRARKDALQ